MWYCPTITLRWGEYMKPDADDDGKLVTMTVAAKAAGLVTKRAAVEKLRRTFGIDNVDAFLESLDEEAAENQKKAMSIASSGALPPNEPDNGEGSPPAKRPGLAFGKPEAKQLPPAK